MVEIDFDRSLDFPIYTTLRTVYNKLVLINLHAPNVMLDIIMYTSILCHVSVMLSICSKEHKYSSASSFIYKSSLYVNKSTKCYMFSKLLSSLLCCQEDFTDAFPKRRKKEIRDISDIIENRMKTLNIIGTGELD